jgi:hypothetical protein
MYLPGLPYTLSGLVLFYFGPAVLAWFGAWFVVRRHYRVIDLPMPPMAAVALLCLALLSCYAGVVISVNVWGE